MATRRDKTIIMDCLTGMTYQQVADKFGIDHSRVGQIMDKAKKIFGVKRVEHLNPRVVGLHFQRSERRHNANSPESFYLRERKLTNNGWPSDRDHDFPGSN